MSLSKHQKKSWFGTIIKLIVSFCLIIVVGLAGSYYWLKTALPEDKGQATVAGLSQEVTIKRDENGVPHIVSGDINSVYAGLGFAHAQDRLWQMELSRLSGQGRLSELFGEKTVSTDIFFRTVDFYGRAKDSLNALSPETKAILKAYASGVNSYIKNQNAKGLGAKWPPEFYLFKHEIEPWQPEDSLVILKLMHLMLADNLRPEITRLSMARQNISGDDIRMLTQPDDGTPGVPPLPDLTKFYKELDQEVAKLTANENTQPNSNAIAKIEHESAVSNSFSENQKLLAAWAALPSTIGGLGNQGLDASIGVGASNNWVVSGSKTKSGKPLLANDPHLALGAPSIWYLAHLQITTKDSPIHHLIGATLAGVPVLVLGRNDLVAWGFTNNYADVQDLFIEKIHASDPTQYLTPTGYQKFKIKQEVIKVKGKPSVTIDVKESRHGPLLPEAYLNIGKIIPQGTGLALAWTGLSREDTTVELAINAWSITDVDSYHRFAASYVGPIQNMVVADSGGNIAFMAPGAIPERQDGNEIMGRAPVPGWLEQYDWKGLIAAKDLPYWLNPPEGYVATANANTNPPGYDKFMTTDWDEPFRQNRVKQLLQAEKLDSEAMQKFQADDYSEAMMQINKALLPLINAAPGTDLDQAKSMLETWNGRYEKDQIAPLVMEAFNRHLQINLFSERLGPVFSLFRKPKVRAVLQIFNGGDATKQWCDSAATTEVETCAMVASKSLQQGIDELKTRYGSNWKEWKYGKIAHAYMPLTPLSNLPYIGEKLALKAAFNGGPFTLNRGGNSFDNEAAPFRIEKGASGFRGVYDFADLNQSLYIQNSGQSGSFLSPAFDQYLARWASVNYITIRTDWADRNNTDNVWKLVKP